ncbi:MULTISPECIES: 5-deoxy-glucuronate isomerase [unclassified Paenibacillus]|uniref:5-deoxy-glucuronate isomerase n=1 Tax=unclassified Paenibacillus TaxID=185978 RepID=UPI001C11A7D2|nr:MULTISPECIES: 5-deoxy-glucuronate isomerase [unclassified Paenibacillus]MBU5441389.1 5-deoxy-glucuronate isomerase [Paenibacillus sp. MSJ-34]CAH0118255.1 5-deoxy-glucuronate isomerase [Paenibacillus sp. CECT 9249]
MSNLIVKPVPPGYGDSRVLAVTPEGAQWNYVGFEVHRIAAGGSLHSDTGGREACLVLLSGKANASTSERSWHDIGQRMSVFEQIPPYSVYVPSGDRYEIEALTDVEVAVCSAPGQGNHKARLIAPEHVGVEVRGSGNMQRHIHNILPEQEPADSLLVVEVFTPGGHWSSYPPHKHDRDALPDESLLEETYYFKIKPEQGFAVQRVYTDDRSLDETLAVRDGEAVLVPRGYHPVSAPPGYDAYYLNVMAGPVRIWKFQNDPDHAWLMNHPSSHK